MSRPTEFRGCIWDEGWEFDAPCVLYYPWFWRRFGIGSNNERIDSLVEDACWDYTHKDGQARSSKQRDLEREMRWRGWGSRFDRRRRAEHVVIRVKWDGDDYEIVERIESIGPPARAGVGPAWLR